MKILIDGDIVAYRSAAVCNEPDQRGLACWQAREMLQGIYKSYPHHEPVVYLSGPNNFRYGLYPEYKANRKNMKKPMWLDAVKDTMMEDGAITTDGYEADDALGINYEPGDIIASIDKDLLQIPGVHYNFVKDLELDIDEWDGLYTFYRQVLTGDSTDNIPGIRGIGPKKADAILAGCTNEQDLHTRVRGAYNDDTAYLLNARLVWILRQENVHWTFPSFGPEEDQSSESMQTTPEESDPSTEPTTKSETDDGIQSLGDEMESTFLVIPS